LWEELAREHPDNPEYLARLVRTCNSLGRSYHHGIRFEEAETAFKEGRLAFDRWAQRRPATAAQQDSLAWLLANLGSLYRKTGRLAAAPGPLEESVALGEGLVRARPGENSQWVLLYALTELGMVFFESGEPGPAESAFRKNLQTARDLVRDHPGNREYQQALAEALVTLGTLAYDLQGRPDEALKLWEQGIELQEKLVATSPRSAPEWSALVHWHIRVAASLRETGQAKAAVERHTTFLRRWKALPWPENLAETMQKELAYVYADRALTWRRLRRYEEARQDYDLAGKIGVLEGRPQWMHLRSLAEGHARVEKGEQAWAAATAETVAREAAGDGERLYLAAGLLARCAGFAKEKQSESYAGRALALLRQAQSIQYFRFLSRRTYLGNDDDFAALRPRSDFQRFLAELSRPAPNGSGSKGVIVPSEPMQRPRPGLGARPRPLVADQTTCDDDKRFRKECGARFQRASENRHVGNVPHISSGRCKGEIQPWGQGKSERRVHWKQVSKRGCRVEITVNIPDDLARRLQPVAKESPQILELGMRAWNAQGESSFSGLTDVLETFAALPTPEEVLALRPSPALQERIEDLLEKNRSGTLSTEDQRSWEQYRYVEHLVRLAKARAALKLKGM